tara:strand:+ start:503 stop:1786 length:1284 start_codon:yes stop_codon:yes gene_type:complete
MNIIYPFILFMGISLSVEFKVDSLTYYSLPPEEKVGDLYRAQLNMTNEWISAEKVASEDNKPEVYFFRHSGRPDSLILLKRKIKKKLRHPYYFAKLLQWKNDEPEASIFVHRELDETQRFYYVEAPDKLHMEHIELNTDNIEKVSMVHNTEIDGEQKIVALVKTISGQDNIPVVDGDIFGMDYIHINIKKDPGTGEDTERITSIRIEPQINSAVLLTFYDGDKQDLRYYNELRTLDWGPLIAIGYNDANDKYDPQFSQSGKYISFLELDRNSKRKTPRFKLYVCPRQIDNNGELIPPNKSSYILVDDNIWNVHTLNYPSEFSMDYSWHTKEDVLFYVKLDEYSKDKWQIWYYDVKSKTKKKLETGTKFNRSIFFSHDGKYIVFVCVDLFDDSTHFKNCDLFGTKEKNRECCGDPNNTIVVVGRLIKK